MITDKQRQKRVELSQVRLLYTVPFFAPGIVQLPVEFTDAIETACTDGKRIKWSRKFFDSLSDDEIVTVQCHEVMHCLHGHIWRAPAGCDWDKWNQATDHAINLLLKEFAAQVTGKGMADPFPFPKPEDSYCADPKFSGMAEEVIYARLPDKPKGGKGKGQGQAGAGAPAPGSMPSFGDIEKPEQGTPDEQAAAKKLESTWQDTLIQSVTIARSRGDCPAGMDRLVAKLLDPKVPWYELLRHWLREYATDDWNWQKPNVEYSGCDFILPKLESEKIGSIVFATDTSGSIDNEALAQFQSEKQSCLDDMKPARLVDIYCDAAVHKIAEYQVGETIDQRAPGGGGTDFRPVFEAVEKLQLAPKCLVYLTDLMGTFPTEDPGYPVLWVTWAQLTEVPFGEVIEVKAS
jgi:predicted metal-dependent peptidase